MLILLTISLLIHTSTQDSLDSFCKDPNSVYDPCATKRCLAIRPPDLPPLKKLPCHCIPGCKCIEGYELNNNTKLCEKIPTIVCTEPNKVYDSCAYKLCTGLILPGQTPPDKPPCRCFEGCKCKDGYQLNSETNKCEAICEDPNAVYDACATRNYLGLIPPGQPIPDEPEYLCQEGCKCKEGYKLNPKINKCEAFCEDPNAVYDACATKNYLGLIPPGQSMPDEAEYLCQEGCKCKDGYKTDEKTKKCVPDSCPKNTA